MFLPVILNLLNNNVCFPCVDIIVSLVLLIFNKSSKIYIEQVSL